MTDFSQELSRLTKNFKDLGNATVNGITTLLNLGANGAKTLQVGLIACYWALAAGIQVGWLPLVPKVIERFFSVPTFVEWAGSRMIELLDPTKYSLAKIAIDLSKNFSYPILKMATKIPVLGGLFTSAMLPYTVGTVIGLLFVSNLVQVFNEQYKVVNQQLNSLKQTKKKEYDEINGYDLVLMSDLRDKNSNHAEPYKLYLSEDGNYIARDLAGKVHQSALPKDIGDLNNLELKLNNPEFESVKAKILDYTSKQGHTVKGNLLRYLQFYAMTVASTGFADANKAFPMRLILSVGAPSCAFLVGCLCGIQPAIALSYAVKLSWAGWALPYGVIGALGAVQKGASSIYETWWPEDHNKNRADKAKREKQEALLEEQRLDATGDKGYRLTDEPNLGQFTNNQYAGDPQNVAAQKEAERLEKRRLALEAHYSRCPVPGKTAQEAAQEALQPRPVPVVMSRVTPSVEPSTANLGLQPDNTATNKDSNRPSFD